MIAPGCLIQPGNAFEELSSDIIGAALTVHRALGPGFLESLYHNALCVALERRNLAFETQRMVEIRFEGVTVGRHLLDLVIRQEIVVELKAVHTLTDAHSAQIRSYLRASRLPVGRLLNFNESTLQVRRFVN